MHHHLFSCLLLYSLFFFSACSEEESPLRSPELRTPIVQGLFLKDGSGNPIGVWGNPNRKISGNTNGCTQKVEILTYPTPSSYQVFLRISSCNLPINAWVTPARLADDLQSDVTNFGSAHLLKAGGLAIKTLTKEQAGLNQIRWDGTDDMGKIVPPGFYRIYIKIDDLLLWENVLLYQDNTDNIPLSLLKLLEN